MIVDQDLHGSVSIDSGDRFTKRKSSPSKKVSSKRLGLKRKKNEDMINFFLSHVSESKRTSELVNILLDRLKSYKILLIDY